MIINNGQENYWGIRYGFNQRVDFCIWVLELDGLQIFPFDKHRDGSGILRAKGMNSESWQSWVRKVVLLLDQRLHWHVEELSLSVAKEDDDFDQAISEITKNYPNTVLTFDKSSFSSAHNKHLIWQEEQYQRAVKVVRDVCGESILPSFWSILPSELWDGQPAVKEILRELWVQYHQFPRRERESQCKISLEQQTNARLWESLRIYHTCLDPLQLHLISYSESSEYVIPPVSAILPVNNKTCNIDAFTKMVLQIAEELAKHKTSNT